MTVSKEHREMAKKDVRHLKARAVVRHPRPNGYPKRPLTAFNIFFRCQRSKLIGEELDEDDECLTLGDLKAKIASAAAIGTKSGQKRSHRKTHGKISFGDLGRIIATRWKNIDPRIKKMYEAQANEESNKYRNAVNKFRKTIDLNAVECASTDHPVQSSAATTRYNCDVPSMPEAEEIKSAFHTGRNIPQAFSSSRNQGTNFVQSRSHLSSEMAKLYSPAMLYSILSKARNNNSTSSDNMLSSSIPYGINSSSNCLPRQYTTNQNVNFPKSYNTLEAHQSDVTFQNQKNALERVGIYSFLAGFSRGQQRIPINNHDRSRVQEHQLRELVKHLKEESRQTSSVTNSTITSIPYSSQHVSGLNSLSQGMQHTDTNLSDNDLNRSFNLASNVISPSGNLEHLMRVQELKRFFDIKAQERDLVSFIKYYQGLQQNSIV